MPRVRMLTSVAGAHRSWAPGELVDMTPEEAAVWADGVRGELVRSDPPATPEARAAPEITAQAVRASRKKH